MSKSKFGEYENQIVACTGSEPNFNSTLEVAEYFQAENLQAMFPNELVPTQETLDLYAYIIIQDKKASWSMWSKEMKAKIDKEDGNNE
jgi:hypothetical protein